MRPLRLELAAFASFPQTVTVDFDSLGGEGVFLIHGATGAGKTSILDGLCYALYGQTAGGERQSHHLRCRQAPGERPTLARLTFRVGEGTFTVSRSPEWQRPVKRGQGTTREPQQARLQRVTAVGEETLADRWREVTEQVEELLGMGADQFRQVVVLPQGQFRRLLSADSAAREEVLKGLLDTARFGRIETALADLARDRRREVETLDRDRALRLEQAGVADHRELSRGIDALRREGEEAGAAAGRLQEQLNLEQAALDRVKEARARLERHDRARASLERVLAGHEEMEGIRQRVDRADRAAGVQVFLDLARDRERELSRLQADLADRTSAATRTDADLAAARKAMGQVEADSGVMDMLARRIALLEASQQDLTKVRELERAMAGLRGRNCRLAAHLARARANRFQELLQDHRSLGEAQEQAHAALADLERRATRVATRLAQAEEALLADQAGQLASRLAPGRPCPVCGATDHPAPATAGTAGRAPDPDPLRRELEGLEAEMARHREQSARREPQLAAQVEKLATLMGEAGGAVPTALDLTAKARSLVEEAQRADRKAHSHPASETPPPGGVEELTRLLDRGEQELALLGAKLEEVAGRLPEGGDPAAELDRARQRRDGLDRALDRARKGLQEAEKAAALAHREAELLREQLPEATRTAGLAEERLLQACREQGFTGVDRVREALLAPEQADHLRQRLAGWDRERQAAELELESSRQDLPPPGTPTDPGPGTAALEAVGKELALTNRRVGEIAQRLATLTTIAERLSRLDCQRAAAAERARLAGRLGEAATGRYGKEGMSFQRWVLAALLEEVVQAAGRRLHAMSRGRYSFERSREKGKGRRVGGLDLNVWDAWTGAARAVATLSGGEGFLAALALALGLSEVVQARSGGRRMEALFIDEGFGSLDTEALEAALNSLDDLRSSERLVAVISHVPELRERISTRLEVVKRTEGSTLTHVIGGADRSR